MTIATTHARPHFVARGVMLIIAGTFLISMQDAVVKIFSEHLTLWQLFVIRGVLTIPLFVLLGWGFNAHKTLLRDAMRPWVLVRGFFIAITLLLFYAALPFSQISTLAAVIYLSPVLIVIFSSFLINEPVKLSGWVGVCLGFLGVLVLLQPGTEAFSSWTLLPLVGVVLYAFAHIITRVHCQDVPAVALGFSLNLAMLFLGVIGSIFIGLEFFGNELVGSHPYIFGEWQALDLSVWFILVHLAAIAAISAFVIAGAYQSAPPSIIATFEYSFLIFAAFWDVFYFETPLTVTAIIGMMMIVGAGMLVLKR
ncbi:MAG: DMT family transporter [Hyphomicrobiales bacterium]